MVSIGFTSLIIGEARIDLESFIGHLGTIHYDAPQENKEEALRVYQQAQQLMSDFKSLDQNIHKKLT